MFPCIKCSKVFFTKGKASTHARRLHSKDGNTLPCDKCAKRFETKLMLKLHKKFVHSGKRFSCDQCDKSCSSKSNLLAHKQSSHETSAPSLHCPKCEKCFRNNTNLRAHLKAVHSKNEQLICDHCNLATSHHSDHFYTHWLEKHQIQMGEGVQCDICGNNAANENSLRKHKSAYHSDKSFSCQLCPKKFTKHGHMKVHELSVHTAEKRYVCDECEVCLSQKCHLHAHIDTHRKAARPWICQNCLKSFTRYAHLKQHNTHVHNDDPTKVTCPQCKMELKNKIRLYIHMRYVHGSRKHKCVPCGYQTTTYSSLKRHNHSLKHRQTTVKNI